MISLRKHTLFISLLIVFFSAVYSQKKSPNDIASSKAVNKMEALVKSIESGIEVNFYPSMESDPDEDPYVLDLLSDHKGNFVIQVKKSKYNKKPLIIGKLVKLKLYNNIDIGYYLIKAECINDINKQSFSIEITADNHYDITDGKDDPSFHIMINNLKKRNFYQGQINNKKIRQIFKSTAIPKKNSIQFAKDSLYAINGSYVLYGCAGGDIIVKIDYLGNRRFKYKLIEGSCSSYLEGFGDINSNRIGKTKDQHCQSLLFDFTKITDEINKSSSIELTVKEPDEYCIECDTYPFGDYEKINKERLIEVTD